jgi:hypothetical protein
LSCLSLVIGLLVSLVLGCETVFGGDCGGGVVGILVGWGGLLLHGVGAKHSVGDFSGGFVNL